MNIYRYPNYEAYVAAQVEANKRKLHNVWVRKETVRTIASYAPASVLTILCHGTRNGAEQAMFREQYPHACVLGTEISDTAKDFPLTVQHDFHEPRYEWEGRFDIVYSNSWDHSYDPVKSLRTWRSQLTLIGRLFIELGVSPQVNCSSAADPLEIQPAEALDLFAQEGLREATTFNSFGVRGNPEHQSVVFVLERA